MTTRILAKHYKTVWGAKAFIASMLPKRFEMICIHNGVLVVSEEVYKTYFKK